MQKISGAVVLLVLSLSACSALNGGTNAIAGQFPFHVALNINGLICGGTIVNQNNVVTAASCFLNNNTMVLVAPNQVSVLPGQLILNWNQPLTATRAIYLHPQYNPFTLENDIAVLRTNVNFNFPATPLPAIAPILMNDNIFADAAQCQVAGYAANNNLQSINLPIVNRDTCNQQNLHFNRIEESMKCVGNVNAGPGVCQNNRGTGLIINGRLSGVLSFGFGCGTANMPGVYTQIRFFSSWIQQQFNREDIPPAGTTAMPRQN